MAERLLRNLADQQMIVISERSTGTFLGVVNKLRKKAESNPPTMDGLQEKLSR